MENEKRLIDANEALRMIENSKQDNPYSGTLCGVAWEMAHNCAISCVEAESCTVDAAEVVRCKDCKSLEITGCYGECRKLVRIVKPWDFCSYGERKENG